MLPQANSWETADRPPWPEEDSPPQAQPSPAQPPPVPRVAAAAHPPRPAAAQPPPAGDPVVVASPASRFIVTPRIGQIACWQMALVLFGVTAGRPWAVAGPAMACAAGLLALTALRYRGRWLYEWGLCYARFRIRERTRYLPPKDGPRAILHLFAPDATLTSMRHDDGDIAVVSRTQGATAVLRPRSGDDPVTVLPRPRALLAQGDGIGVQLVFHGVAGKRSHPLAWVTVQAAGTTGSAEGDAITRALGDAVTRARDRLADGGIVAAGLDRTGLLRTVASLTHVGGDRGDVRERWRCWCCGPIAQACFRLRGWAALPDSEARQLLRRLLTARVGAVVTVAVHAAAPWPETAALRVAAPDAERLELSVPALRALAARHDVRLDRMDGEHAAGVSASLPLGCDRPST